MILQPVSLNLHAVGLHFVENITGIEEIQVVDPELSEEEEQFQQGHTPPSPGLQWVWDQLSPLLQGQHQPASGRTIRTGAYLSRHEARDAAVYAF